MARKDSKGSGVSPALRTRLAQIRACEASGESLKAYAERHGISPTRFTRRSSRRAGGACCDPAASEDALRLAEQLGGRR